MVIAVVGAGGKTTYIHKLAREYQQAGKKVLVLTTTHMYIEENTVVSGDLSIIKSRINNYGYCMAGEKSTDSNKMTALSPALYSEACKLADVVLIEADGSRHMPLKCPNENEPVIPDNCDKVVIVAGLSALTKPCKDVVHRSELACAWLGITPDTAITATHIQTLIRKGYLEYMEKNHPSMDVEFELTQADTLYKRVIASFIKENRDVSILKKEWFEPSGELVICGGGHVSQFVAKMASLIDFKITVIDDREEFVNHEHFPQADKLLCCSYDELSKHLPDSDNAYYVVVTRGHMGDEQCVESILHRKYAYLGMIGSRKKVAATMDSLAKKGYTKEQRDSIHSPIGISIGARTPAEIAVSICAELVQVKNSKTISTISKELAASTEHGTLCIILDKKGSSPRGEGSMMLVTNNGIIGTIGGGTMEMQAIEFAKTVDAICEKEYTLNNTDSADLGMICGGSNLVLFVPLR